VILYGFYFVVVHIGVMLRVSFYCSVVVSDVHPLVLCFRVKYYPSDPLMLKEELTR